MIDAKNHHLIASVAAILGVAVAGITYAADEPKAAPDLSKASTESASKSAPDSGHIMMNHSIDDTKSMNMMKDKTVPIHNPCKPASKAKHSSAPVDHIMLNHSIGDSKSMNMMKDKKVPIHHSGDAATPAAESTSK
jgi:hypothetical protein